MDGSVCNDVAPLLFFEFVLASFELSVIEVELLICGCDTYLILGYSLSFRGHLLVNCIVEAEPVHFPSEGLNSLQLRP